jgi:Cu(I)/Ag(I) efflux system membrane fusion protein
VERGVLRQDVRTTAQVTFDETRVRAVTLKFDGWVDKLFVDFTGRAVRAGEPLLSAYSPMLIAAEQELVLAAKLVREMSGADSSTRANAEGLHRAARQRLLNWDVPVAEIDRVEQGGDVQKTLMVRAPYGGVILEKKVLEGQRIMAGDPLYQLADLSIVWVEGEVFEQDLSLVKVGEQVEIEFKAWPGKIREGRIVFVQPTVDADTRTARIRVSLDNADGQLKPGMYATVNIRSVATMPVLHVPRSALLSTGERNLVFVKRADGMLEPRDVVPGLATDDRVELKSGVQAGETVVSSATFLVDAESNLGSMLGGMGGMPGMDMTPPVSQPPQGTRPPAKSTTPPAHVMPDGMVMPGMDMPAPASKAKKGTRPPARN